MNPAIGASSVPSPRLERDNEKPLEPLFLRRSRHFVSRHTKSEKLDAVTRYNTAFTKEVVPRSSTISDLVKSAEICATRGLLEISEGLRNRKYQQLQQGLSIIQRIPHQPTALIVLTKAILMIIQQETRSLDADPYVDTLVQTLKAAPTHYLDDGLDAKLNSVRTLIDEMEKRNASVDTERISDLKTYAQELAIKLKTPLGPCRRLTLNELFIEVHPDCVIDDEPIHINQLCKRFKTDTNVLHASYEAVKEEFPGNFSRKGTPKLVSLWLSSSTTPFLAAAQAFHENATVIPKIITLATVAEGLNMLQSVEVPYLRRVVAASLLAKLLASPGLALSEDLNTVITIMLETPADDSIEEMTYRFCEDISVRFYTDKEIVDACEAFKFPTSDCYFKKVASHFENLDTEQTVDGVAYHDLLGDWLVEISGSKIDEREKSKLLSVIIPKWRGSQSWEESGAGLESELSKTFGYVIAKKEMPGFLKKLASPSNFFVAHRLKARVEQLHPSKIKRVFDMLDRNRSLMSDLSKPEKQIAAIALAVLSEPNSSRFTMSSADAVDLFSLLPKNIRKGVLKTAFERPFLGQLVLNRLSAHQKLVIADGGTSTSTCADFLLATVDCTSGIAVENGEKTVVDIQSIPIENNIDEEAIQRLVKNESSCRFHAVKGRTLIFETPRHEFIAVKLLKRGENKGELIKEYQHQVVKRLQKTKSSIPTAVGVYDAMELEAGFAQRIRESGVDIDDSGACLVYKAPLEYWTYANDPILTREERVAGIEKAAFDLMNWLKEGQVFTALTERFHNIEGGGRRYEWMIDLCQRRDLRQGMGRLDSVSRLNRYPNIRQSGISDLAEMTSLKSYMDEFRALKDTHDLSPTHHLFWHGDATAERLFVSKFIGDYLFDFTL
ncbi:MAG: hypothetical protein ACI9BD_001436, partial [Candidatus Marinamargulisbacteria bacterium]